MDKPTVGPRAGRDYPTDLAQLRTWFPTDGDCLDYLDFLRWPEGFVCPRCQAEDAIDEAVGHYRCRGCWARVSVTSGTIFERTRTPLTVWFEAIWLLTADKTGISAAHLHRVLPIASYQTAWTMLAKLRSVMSTAQSQPLSGRVEIDETFFGGPRPGKAGRGALGKTLVAGAIEITGHRWGRARLAVIPDASADSLQAFVQANVAAGSTVVTDGWTAYPPALTVYQHEKLNVSASGTPAHESLPAVHRLFALVKRSIDGTYHGSTSAEHLSEFLDEFIFRFNRRHSRHRGMVFMRLIERAVTGGPVTYRDLVRNPRPKAIHPPGVTGPRSQPGSLQAGPSARPWRDES